jgi:uncharacterized membrane protein YecN with MAPEG domain
MSSYYAVVSGLIFAAVSVAHLARILKGTPVQVGAWAVPMSLSWVGLLVSALLAIWGFMQSGH